MIACRREGGREVVEVGRRCGVVCGVAGRCCAVVIVKVVVMNVEVVVVVRVEVMRALVCSNVGWSSLVWRWDGCVVDRG